MTLCKHERWVKTSEDSCTCLDCKFAFPFATILKRPYIIAAIEGSVMNLAGCDTVEARTKFLEGEARACGHCFFQEIQKQEVDIEGRTIKIVISLD